MAEKVDTEIQVPLVYHIPEDMPYRYATNLVVQHTEHEFILSFFRASPPFLLGSPEELKEQLAGLESIRADCIARVIVATSKMPEFVEALQANLGKFASTLSDEEDRSE